MCLPPLARVGAGCDRDRVKRGAYLSCLASSWPHFQSCFSGAWSRVSPLRLFLCKGWLLTTYPSQGNHLLPQPDLLLGAETKPFHCQFLSSCDQDKILCVWDPRLPPGMPQKWQVMLFCVFPERSSFGFQQPSFCLSPLQYSIRYWGSALLQHEHIFSCQTSWGDAVTAPCLPNLLLKLIGEILCSLQMGGIVTLACSLKQHLGLGRVKMLISSQ